MKLEFADIVRDGGSLIAGFRDDDGALFSLFLHIGRAGLQGVPPHYRSLTMSSDVRPEHGAVVPVGGEEEARIFAALDQWLLDPQFSAAHASNSAERLRADCVRDLRREAAIRGER